MPNPPESRFRPRLLLLCILLALPLGGWAILKQIPKVVETGAGGALDLLLVLSLLLFGLVWLLFLSRLAWSTRLVGCALILAAAILLKMDGHTGSFFPQFSWRWSQQAAREMPELAGALAAEGEVLETAGPGELPAIPRCRNEQLGCGRTLARKLVCRSSAGTLAQADRGGLVVLFCGGRICLHHGAAWRGGGAGLLRAGHG